MESGTHEDLIVLNGLYAYLYGFSVPKLHVRHLFGRIRPQTWRFEGFLDRAIMRSGPTKLPN